MTSANRTTITLADGTTEIALVPLTTTLTFDDSMTDTLELTAGDTRAPLRARLFGPGDDEPADLSNARRVEIAIKDRAGDLVLEERAEVDESTDESGWVHYSWSRRDTDTPGTYTLRFRVTYDDNSVLHYPNGRAAKLHLRSP